MEELEKNGGKKRTEGSSMKAQCPEYQSMSDADYINCIIKMIKKLDSKKLRKVFNYVHMMFVRSAGN